MVNNGLEMPEWQRVPLSSFLPSFLRPLERSIATEKERKRETRTKWRCSTNFLTSRCAMLSDIRSAVLMEGENIGIADYEYESKARRV